MKVGRIGSFTPWKLVMAELISATLPVESLDGEMEALFGPIDYAGPPMAFTQTDYYHEEMGGSLTRRFVSFRTPVLPDRLAEIKILTNGLEEKHAEDGRRRINLDPGILNLSRFVLATTKDNSHRIALRDGIYAELTLQYARRDFQVLPWTYPDYALREYRDILLEIREILKKEGKRGGT